MKSLSIYIWAIALMGNGCDSLRSDPENSMAAGASLSSRPSKTLDFKKDSVVAKGSPEEKKVFTRLVRDFDREEVDMGPEGFLFARTGKGPPGRWIIQKESSAPSGERVLAQLDSHPTYYRFPLAVLKEPSLRDLRLKVRCKAFWGRIDQVCGLVARYQDADNYYVARSNALENNVRIYLLKDGEREELAAWQGEVTSEDWHQLEFALHGDHLEVFWDGDRVIDHRDSTFQDEGRVGLWTKADANSYFDDFEVSRE